MFCQCCGVEAPTKHVTFHQNIGALVIRFPSTLDGNLCKSCIHSNFWKMTGTSLILGWWGIISFFVNVFFILSNIITYLCCLGMEPVPPNAVAPELTDEAIERLTPHTEYIVNRMNQNEPLESIAQDIAMRSSTTPGQVTLYIMALIQASQQQHG